MGVTNYKIACFVLCLLCLEFVMSSVCLSKVCYSIKERERESERKKEGER